jgi:molybdopterin molybdotransferase/putative molybdopterin biosynthesis protein
MFDLHNKKAPTRREAIDAILSRWTLAPRREIVSLDDAAGRVTAEDVFSLHDLPVVRASAMDGVSVASTAFADGAPDTSLWREGREYERADTGDDFDDRFDAVIQIEAVDLLPGGGISIAADMDVKPGMNVRPAGSTVKKGELLAAAGTRLRPFDLAALALGGAAEIAVIQKPVVAFIPTGNELIPAGRAPERGQTVDSNSVMVRHMLLEMGAAPLCLPIVRDDADEIRAAVARAAREAVIVLLCGGSSKGNEDLNARIAGEMGEELFHWIASAPGRPLCAAMLDGKPLINMPGPPVATYFVMDWCVRALVSRFLGLPEAARKTVSATLCEDMAPTEGMEILRKLELEDSDGAYRACFLELRAISTVRALTASAQFVTDMGPRGKVSGEAVEVELLR